MMLNSFSVPLLRLEDSKKFAETLAKCLEVGDVICLQGTLGSGKTTFSQMLINSHMQHDMHVTSPTFNLVQHYEREGHIPVWHCDFYRLKEASEIIELGLDEAFDRGISIIEWPEIATNYLPESRLQIHFKLTYDPENQTEIRHAHFDNASMLGQALGKEISQW